MKIHILVLNYNGRDLLEKYLASIVKAADHSTHDCKVMVVDNLSSDNSAEFVEKSFPSVELFTPSKNRVLCSYNEALKGLDSDIVILLNNDIEVAEDFVDYLASHFENKDLFFAAPRLLNFDNTYNGGRSYLRFKFGILKNVVDAENAESPGETHSISTGAFRRADFLNFGGFDELYLPGIWEEVDLCYRALLCGKKGVYEPKSVIWHHESTTFNREYGAKGKLKIAHRNMFLFVWKNVLDKKLLTQHLLLLPLRLLYSICSGRTEMAQGFMMALPRLPETLGRRSQRKERSHAEILRDRDIIR